MTTTRPPTGPQTAPSATEPHAVADDRERGAAGARRPEGGPAGLPWGSGRADLVLAVGLAVWAVLEVLPDGPDPLAGEIAFALVMTLPVALLRRAPLGVLGVAVAALLLRAATASAAPATVAPFPTILLAVFATALYTRSAAGAAAGCALALGGMLGAERLRFYGPETDVSSLVVMVFFIVGAWGAGLLLRRRDAAVRAAEERVRERAREAVAAERLRIARELHDVVAHALSVIAVNAGAASEVGKVDPERARGHMDAVARTARQGGDGQDPPLARPGQDGPARPRRRRRLRLRAGPRPPRRARRGQGAGRVRAGDIVEGAQSIVDSGTGARRGVSVEA